MLIDLEQGEVAFVLKLCWHNIVFVLTFVQTLAFGFSVSQGILGSDRDIAFQSMAYLSVMRKTPNS